MTVDAPPVTLFELISDMPNYGDWLPASNQFARTEAEPYPVQIGTRYHDGQPDEPGKSWWGSVTGFQPPGSIDFHHTITVRQLRATVDVHIHYSFEPQDDGAQRTNTNRWLVLDFAMPLIFRPARRAITSAFDKENVRTIAALKRYAEAHPDRDDRRTRARTSMQKPEGVRSVVDVVDSLAAGGDGETE
ncbi:MAG TPA: SRPBCC family protein [Solirubrobacteraceae bacterium]|nr:SRPBCC family protein [Solirubrobacteraceae bacterium]